MILLRGKVGHRRLHEPRQVRLAGLFIFVRVPVDIDWSLEFGEPICFNVVAPASGVRSLRKAG